MHIPSLQPFWKALHRLLLPVFSPSGRGWARRTRIVYRITLPSLCDMAQPSTKRETEREERKECTSLLVSFFVFPPSFPYRTHSPLLWAGVSNGAVFACSCSEPLWTISVFTGVISYHSCVGEFRRVRCSKLPNDTAR